MMIQTNIQINQTPRLFKTIEKIKNSKKQKWKLSYKVDFATVDAVTLVITESIILWTLVFIEGDSILLWLVFNGIYEARNPNRFLLMKCEEIWKNNIWVVSIEIETHTQFFFSNKKKRMIIFCVL